MAVSPIAMVNTCSILRGDPHELQYEHDSPRREEVDGEDRREDGRCRISANAEVKRLVVVALSYGELHCGSEIPDSGMKPQGLMFVWMHINAGTSASS